MRVYWIDVPYVSSGMRRTYRKNLEVFSGETGEDEGVLHVDTAHKYMPNKRTWVEKTTTNMKHSIYYRRDPVVYDTMPTIPDMKREEQIVFATLEMAQAAKLVLVQSMARAYERELADLKKLFDRNVPKVEEPLKELKEEYPEYFI